jgi:hypothetical protein
MRKSSHRSASRTRSLCPEHSLPALIISPMPGHRRMRPLRLLTQRASELVAREIAAMEPTAFGRTTNRPVLLSVPQLTPRSSWSARERRFCADGTKRTRLALIPSRSISVKARMQSFSPPSSSPRWRIASAREPDHFRWAAPTREAPNAPITANPAAAAKHVR